MMRHKASEAVSADWSGSALGDAERSIRYYSTTTADRIRPVLCVTDSDTVRGATGHFAARLSLS
eukprot:1425294-Prymnesium_polylepis.1